MTLNNCLKKINVVLLCLVLSALLVVGLCACKPKDESNQGNNNDNEVDVFIFMGQSNMSGHGNANEAIPCEQRHGYEFRAVSGNDQDGWLYPIEEPFGITEANDAISDMRKGGLVSAFCESYYQTTGVPVVGVSASKSGSSIDYWAKGTPAYNEAVSRLNACLTYLNDKTDMVVRNVAMVWCQGETDAWATEYNNFDYRGKLIALYEGMKADASVSHCLIVTPSMYTDNTAISHKYNLIQKQVALCAETDEFLLVARKFENVPLILRDDPHFYQGVYNVCGWEAGKVAGTFFESGFELPCDLYREGEAEALAEQFGITLSYNPNA